MRAQRLAFALFLGLPSCVADLQLDLPPLSPGTKAVLIGVDNGKKLDVYAFDASDLENYGLVVDVDRGQEARVNALLYARSLEELQISAGRLESAAADQSSRRIPVPEALYSAELANERTSSWTMGQVSTGIFAFRIPTFDWRTCLAAGGCSDSSTEDEICTLPCPEPSPVDQPMIPAPPQMPILPQLSGTCPPGWSLVTLANPPLQVCEAPDSLSCGPGEAQLPGSSGCTLVGGPCPADGWPEIADGTPVLYVRRSAMSGGVASGTKDAPYTTIAEALGESAPGMVIALASGTYVEDVVLTEGRTLAGACARDTVIRSFGTPTTITVRDANATLRNLSVIGGSDEAVTAYPGATLAIQGVIVDAAGASFGVAAVDGAASLDIDTSEITGFNVAGIGQHAGSMVHLRSTTIENGAGPAVDAEDAGTVLSVERSTFRSLGAGVIASAGAQATITDTLFENCTGIAAAAAHTGSSLSLDGVLVRNVHRRGSTPGIAVIGGASASIARTRVSHSLQGLDVVQGGTATASDLAITDLDAVPNSGGLVVSEGAIELARAAIASGGDFGAAIIHSSATISDLSVDDVRIETRTRHFRALEASGSVLELSRFAARHQGNAVLTLAATHARLQDLSIFGEDPPRGFVATATAAITVYAADVEADRVRVEHHLGGALQISTSTHAIFRDLLFQDLGSSSTNEARTGIFAFETPLVLERVQIERCSGDGIHLEHNARLDAAHVTVRDAGEDGIYLVPSTSGTLHTAMIERSLGSGLRARDLLATDLTARDGIGALPGAAGVRVILGGSFELQRFRVQSNHGFGVLYFSSTSQESEIDLVHMSDGEVSDNDVGLHSPLTLPGRSVFERVTYRGNGVDIEAEE